MNTFKDNPHYCETPEGLFVDGVAWIAVANRSQSPTGFTAFAYPERTYGYLAFTEIKLEDIPRLIELAENRGFAPHDLQDAANDDDLYAPESWKTSGHLAFRYSLPGAKWWSEFPENFIQVIK